MERKESSFMSFLVGLLSGIIVGILYAPRSGKETREILKKVAEEYSEKGKEVYREKSKDIKEALEVSSKTAREKIDTIKEKAEQVSQSVSKKVKELTSKENNSDVEPLPEE